MRLFKLKLLSSTLLWYCLSRFKVILKLFESVYEIHGVTIQMIATEQYFPVVPFIILYQVALTFGSVDEILKCDHSNESY